MFTGLVEDLGILESVEVQADAREFAIRPAAMPVSELALGDSVAVNGVCLTATNLDRGTFTVLAGTETLSRTTLGDLEQGSQVHLERAMRLGDRMGGHLVQGHVDGVGVIAGSRTVGADLELTIEADSGLLRYVVEKGSICVDGVSLTVAQMGEFSFSVALIPHTVRVTCLARKPPGGRVNLEVDMIGKYVERLLGPHLPGSS